MAKHSYSGIKTYEGCPRKYNETKILKLWPREESEANLYGTQLHAVCEDHIKDGTPLPDSFKFLQPLMDSIKAMPGRKMCELEMGVKETLQPCAFNDPDYWARGIADLVVVDDDNYTARVFDYKSGNDKYPDTDQLMLMSLMIFAHFPHIKSITGGLLFVMKGTVQKYKVNRAQESELWWRWRERVAKLDASIFHNQWQMRPSGLCRKWCEVLTCNHNGRST